MAYSKEQNKLASLSLTKSFTRQILLNSLKYSQRAKEKHEKKKLYKLRKTMYKNNINKEIELIKQSQIKILWLKALLSEKLLKEFKFRFEQKENQHT